MSSIPKGLIHMQQTTALTDLHGQIERLTYFDEESGYTIAKVKIYGNKDLVTGPASAR
jgi:exodeoxyribonuclease V alpha subunit